MSGTLANAPSSAPPAAPTLGAVEIMAAHLGMERDGLRLALARHCAPPEAGNADLIALCAVAKELDLNPLLKQVYLIKQKGGRVEITVGVDGVLAMIQRHELYVSHRYEFLWKGEEWDLEGLLGVQCFVKKRFPTAEAGIYEERELGPFTALMAEYYYQPYGKGGQPYDGPWQKYPTSMISWKALRLMARNCFGFTVPDETSYEQTPVTIVDAEVNDAQPDAAPSAPASPFAASDVMGGLPDDGAPQPGGEPGAGQCYLRADCVRGWHDDGGGCQFSDEVTP